MSYNFYHPVNNPFYYVNMYASARSDANTMRTLDTGMYRMWTSPHERHCLNTVIHFYDNPDNYSKPVPSWAISGLDSAYKRDSPNG